MAGPDTRVLSLVPNAHVDITGISGSPLEQLPLVQCAALVNTLDKGQVILIMLQYAHLPKGKTSHSKSQLESFGCSVHDSALHAGGKQCIYTPEGYVIHLHVRHGFFYMDMQPLPMMTSIITHMSFSLPTPHGILTMSTKNSIMMSSRIPSLQKIHFFKALRMHMITILMLMVVFICISWTPYRTNQRLQMICFLTLMNPLTLTWLPT